MDPPYQRHHLELSYVGSTVNQRAQLYGETERFVSRLSFVSAAIAIILLSCVAVGNAAPVTRMINFTDCKGCDAICHAQGILCLRRGQGQILEFRYQLEGISFDFAASANTA